MLLKLSLLKAAAGTSSGESSALLAVPALGATGEPKGRNFEMHHVLEHLGQQTEVYLKIIQELYRICRSGAKIHITVPHHRSDRFFHDPTHVRAITPVGLSMFSKRQNREWQAQGKAFTLLALYLDVDFELVDTAYTPSEVWFERYPKKASDLDLLLKESTVYSNLIKDVEMILMAVK